MYTMGLMSYAYIEMDSMRKRLLLFLIGCMGVRSLLVYIAKTIDINYLPILGYLAILPAIGFAYIYGSGSRKTGPEVFGDKIWWNDLRPVHSALYGLFAYSAIMKHPNSWLFLLTDVSIGFVSFLVHRLTGAGGFLTDEHLK